MPSADRAMIKARISDLSSQELCQELSSVGNYQKFNMPNVTGITASAREHVGRRKSSRSNGEASTNRSASKNSAADQLVCAAGVVISRGRMIAAAIASR